MNNLGRVIQKKTVKKINVIDDQNPLGKSVILTHILNHLTKNCFHYIKLKMAVEKD